MSIKDAMRNPICTNCGGPVIIGDISVKEAESFSRCQKLHIPLNNNLCRNEIGQSENIRIQTRYQQG